MTARRPLAFLVLLVTLLAGCRGPDDREIQQKRAAAEQQRRQAQLLCQQTRQALPPLLAGFSRSGDRLASIESEAYVPSPAPAPLDPEEQRRLAVYDQEIEQEQYDQAQAAWQERESQRRAVWRRDRAARLAVARRQHAAAVAALRRAYPSLLTSSDAPRLIAAERERLLACGGVAETPS